VSKLEVTLNPSVDIDPIPTGAGGIVRGQKITVKGTADCRKETVDTEHPENDSTKPSPESITEVAVRLGSSGLFVKANPTGPVHNGHKTWSTWTTDSRIIIGVVTDDLQITARVSAGVSAQAAQAFATVAVAVDRTPPDLDLTTPDPDRPEITQELANGKTTFELAGTADDELSPVVAVEWVLDHGQHFTLATPRAPGDWSSWTAAVQVSRAGTHELQLRARDGEENTTPPDLKVTLNAVEIFQPPDPSDVFNQAGYLDDLLKFAGRRVVDAEGTALTPAMLTTAYRQRFADLTDPNNHRAATTSVRQVRVCVEVMRAILKGVGKSAPPAEEAKYRERAYASLLSGLGTSLKEIGRARGDEDARVRLAARLGVDRPDRLDQLTLLPEQVTEAKLEQLFGLQDTTRNPLVRRPRALLLTWQLRRLRAQWQEQDDAARVYGDIVPIIDPDRVVERDFRTRNKAADPAFGMWNDRRDEMAAILKQIDDLRKSKSTPLAGFDAVVHHFVAKVKDLTALLTDYQAGKDIGPQLIEKRLDLAAFLRLMRTRDLAAAGTVLDADWADVYAIAAQVAKLGLYPVWRAEEQAEGITLGPDYFVLPDPTTPPADLPEWRATLQARRAWQVTLQTRISQKEAVIQALRAVTDAAEGNVLSGLRDVLVATAGDATRGLLIELAAGAAQRTSRIAQAIETLQGALFAVRAGAVTTGHPAAGWKLSTADHYSKADFDEDWVFWGSHETWQGAMRVFIYPESHLLPTLRPDRRPKKKEPTHAFESLIAELRGFARITADEARAKAAQYLGGLRKELGTDLPSELQESPGPKRSFVITERLTDTQLAHRQALSAELFGRLTDPDPHEAPSYLKEVFYFVPLLCALQLRRSGEYVAALDWFRSVYAYHLPPGRLKADQLPSDTPPDPLPDRRHIYYGLTLEEQIPAKFRRPADWPRDGLNPHDIVLTRPKALTRFIAISLVQCFEAFADAEFTRDTDESVARARALYQTALDLLGLEYPASGSTAAAPSDAKDDGHKFPLDPVVDALRLHAKSNLRKLRLGFNIAGLARQVSPELAAGTAIAPSQPTPYRYAALIARAKELTQIAAQMEAALLAALEKRAEASYNLLKAIQDVELARKTVFLHRLRVKEAVDGMELAALQKGRAQIQFDHFDRLINEGRSKWEYLELAAAGIGALASTNAAGAFEGLGSVFGQMASNERREQDWELQRDLAEQDKAIGGFQLTLAADQVVIATEEQGIAQIQMDHAGAIVQFLAGKFTSPELYEFMSEVLDGVYRFFLQQATALAKLAEDQLAFERQEPRRRIIQGDYYAAPDGGSEGRGMTGSARLLADVVQLDQHAFLTDRRKLQLTKAFSLARLAPVELQLFRETGVLVVGTPQEQFDRDFPGHYLRLVRRVRTSVIALIPPTDGIHATLSTSGTSRVVIGGDTFRNVLVRRDPETIGLSSPRDATGLFELQPDSQPELLLPFEGTGVDTVWRFELPKAANQFDYSTIADVLLTLEYTALNSFDYRQQVIQTLDPEVSVDRPFSFRLQFPDQWYDLHNPDQTPKPMTMRFATTRGDFVPNIENLRVRQLVLYFAPATAKPVEVRDVRLLFTRQGDDTPAGGSADSIDGIISTRRPNGANWVTITGTKPPIGEWELSLPNDDTTKSFFKNEDIQDILFVITYSGRTPEWPS